ncbi:hypothetical protein [Nonomuraea sp. 10N515B]|uniref:hypothetical protein n=1 Tax=Nonomuraea sp. 10N515B TaxID=3457422 RepID=UPI003FCEDD6B
MREETTIAERMARREARALLLVPPSIPAPPGVLDPQMSFRAVRCPWCGVGPACHDERPPNEPPDRPLVTVLACEWLANRAMLAVLAAGRPAGSYLSRAVFAARHRTLGNATDLLAALDAAERWADPLTSAGAVRDAVVPAATRSTHSVVSHFLSPHAGREFDDLNTLYARVRLGAVRAGLGGRSGIAQGPPERGCHPVEPGEIIPIRYSTPGGAHA